jgi:hypothetical protein
VSDEREQERARASIFDMHQPHPDVTTDTMRRWLLRAVEDLRGQLLTQQDHRLLLAGLQALSDAYLAEVEASRADRESLAARCTELEQQMAAVTAALP